MLRGDSDLIIKSIKVNKKFIAIFLIFSIIFLSILLVISDATSTDTIQPTNTIKWVDFKVTADAMSKASAIDINSHLNDDEIKFNWIELLSILACKNSGDFSSFKESDLDSLVNTIKSGITVESLTSELKLYSYYKEAYTAVLGGFIGNYFIQSEDENGELIYTSRYGLKVFSPIAKHYHFSHYDDFGSSRSYGFDRTHLGNDLIGTIGTPIIAIESGIVENIGWNQFGGWRIGIRSFDQQRYYYYAHLRKDHPYVSDLEKGSIIKAGDVIGYLGMTGYSTTENVNNVNIPHLHLGLELIFDQTIIDTPNEIWIDVYEIVEFLQSNKSETYLLDDDTKDHIRKYDYMEDYLTD